MCVALMNVLSWKLLPIARAIGSTVSLYNFGSWARPTSAQYAHWMACIRIGRSFHRLLSTPNFFFISFQFSVIFLPFGVCMLFILYLSLFSFISYILFFFIFYFLFFMLSLYHFFLHMIQFQVYFLGFYLIFHFKHDARKKRLR